MIAVNKSTKTVSSVAARFILDHLRFINLKFCSTNNATHGNFKPITGIGLKEQSEILSCHAKL
jgi:hypothetical protein